MDASCKIQRSIHDVRLTYKYVSRILGTYHFCGDLILFYVSILHRKRGGSMDIIKLKETILQDKVFLIQIFKKYSVWEKKRRSRHRDFLPVLLKVDILK